MSFSPSTSSLTAADKAVLRNLHYDIRHDIRDSHNASHAPQSDDDDSTLRPFLDSNSHEGWIFTSWDSSELNTTLNHIFAQPYLRFAKSLVRQDPDAVFITHLLVHFTLLLPSAIYLYINFHWLHAVAHTVFAVWNAGPFTLMLHNHIHNNGILARPYRAFDRMFPYITGPLMGHTWNSYYYHHVKMHHVEGNGPEDLSTTIFYQRDEITEFLKYLGSFLVITWIQLPIYFWRNKKYALAAKALVSECASMGAIFTLAYLNTRPAVFTLLLPWAIMRIGMMVGNWGQHCLVDNVDPMSDFRSSITLIDVSSNRHCFNDGYHTSHHLNPLRHWKSHPAAFLRDKHRYQTEGALTFANIDYIMITICCITKNFDRLAEALVPMGEQIGMSHEEKKEMLRGKCRRFTSEEVATKFLRGARGEDVKGGSVKGDSTTKLHSGKEARGPTAVKPRRSSISVAADKAKDVVGQDLLRYRM